MLTLLELLPLPEELLLVLMLVELLLPDLPALIASVGASDAFGAIGASLQAAAVMLVRSAMAPVVT
jgi:hypothetical protein